MAEPRQLDQYLWNERQLRVPFLREGAPQLQRRREPPVRATERNTVEEFLETLRPLELGADFALQHSQLECARTKSDERLNFRLLLPADVSRRELEASTHERAFRRRVPEVVLECRRHPVKGVIERVERRSGDQFDLPT